LWPMTKRRISANTWRWGILCGIAAGILLLRIGRGEGLQGLNPLLFIILLAGLYLLYRSAKNKS
jgi:hypothetical protein